MFNDLRSRHTHSNGNRDSVQALDPQKLKQELDAAHNQLEEYTASIGSLYNELRKIREAICPGCKEKVLRSNIAASLINLESQQSSSPRLATSKYPTLDAVNLSPSRIPIRVGNPRSSRSPRSVSVCQRMASLASRSELKDPPNIPAYPNSNSSKRKWSIEYNPEVKRVLEVNPLYTILHPKRVWRAKFSRDGQFLAVVTRFSQTVTIYCVATRTKACVLEDLYVRESEPGMYDLDFSPDSRHLATSVGLSESKIRIWDIGKQYVCKSFNARRFVISLNFSPDGRFLLSSCDGTIIIWNMRDGSSRMLNSNTKISCGRFSPDGRHAIAGSSNGWVLIWDVRSGLHVALFTREPRSVKGIVFTQDVGRLISGSQDGKLKCWDISGFTKMTRLSGGEEQVMTTQKERFNYVGHTGSLTWLCISSDNQWIASSSSDRTVRIWNTRDNVHQCVLQGHEEQVLTVDFSPTGSYLASASEDGEVQIWRFGFGTIENR